MKDRLKNIQEWVVRLADNESSVMDDIKFLLDSLQLTVNSLHNREIELEKAQEKIAELEETYTDIHGAIWEPPTSYAYAMVCKAREKGRDRERVLREALEKIIDRYNIPQNDLKNHVGDLMCQIARKALHQTNKSASNAKIVAKFTRQEVKPNGNN